MSFVSFLYCISSEHTEKNGNCRKLGYTINPEHRMRVYNTGDAPGIGLEKRYDSIWEINAKNRIEGQHFEKILHMHFKDFRKKRDNGNYSEWFSVPLEKVRMFMNSQDFVVRELTIKDIEVIHKRSERKPIDDERTFIKEEECLIEKEETYKSLKDDFFETFLEGYIPRRIQLELWEIFYAISMKDTIYKGIIQWATGTGKTIALLILFVISADKCKREGRIFRGLLISPTNDIFDTIIHHIQKLSNYGIIVCEGHHARLSNLKIPHDKHVLVTSTHASLTEIDLWNNLPPMNHIHYDEVHRITGDKFYEILKEMIVKWDTTYLTGTSATPNTCLLSQHKKMEGLFGNPLKIIHKCDVDEAIQENWIAQPRFGVHVIPLDKTQRIVVFLNIIQYTIKLKMDTIWKGGKVIVYLPFRTDVCDAVNIAKDMMPEARIYTAVENANAPSDDLFVSDPADGIPRLLFACERYREGSDIRGLEMTIILMGNKIGANILLQVAGRALRNDYIGKEGWCILVRPSEEGTTENDVFDSIVLEIMEFIGKETNPCSSNIRNIVEKFFGSVSISGKMYDVDETIKRLQCLFVRRAFQGSPKERYDVIRNVTKELGFLSKEEYEDEDHPKYIYKPKLYLKDYWVSWYKYLGVDTYEYNHNTEWKRFCKDSGLTTWEKYKNIELYENSSDNS